MALELRIFKMKDYVYSVEIKGSLDSDTFKQFEAEVAEIIDEKTKAVILDMSGLNYIGSAGVRSILWLKKELAKNNASFTMTNLQPQIKKVFDMLKILPMFDIFDDMPEADKYIDQIIQDEIKKQNA